MCLKHRVGPFGEMHIFVVASVPLAVLVSQGSFVLSGRRTAGLLTLASFPVPRPAFRRLQYGKRRKAGRGTGNEAILTLQITYVSILWLCLLTSYRTSPFDMVNPTSTYFHRLPYPLPSWYSTESVTSLHHYPQSL